CPSSELRCLDLSSSPTRRSSDLDGTDDQLVQVKSHAHDARRLAQIARYTALGQINSAQLQKAQAEVQRVRAEGGGTAALVGKRVDRKSTRLNSSHVSISYAVFCL